MASLDERMADLEALTDKHAAAVAALRTDIGGLRLELRTDIAALRGDMATLRGDMALRSETVELRRELAGVRAEMATRSEISDLRGEMNHRFDAMDQKFIWLTGTQVATLLAVVGVLAGALLR